MSFCIPALLFASALASALASGSEEDKPLLAISGNLVLDEEVYRAIVDFPDEAKATKANARLVRTRISDFLRRAGYELAKVRAHVEDDQILVDIDEGRVDKVIVLGQGAYTTLRVKLDLNLPHDVFNRPMLDRQLKKLAEKYGLKNYRYELVNTRRKEHLGPQIESLGTIGETPVIQPEAPLELHLLLEGFEWQTGLSPDLAVSSFEGVGMGARWRLRSIFFDRDRLEMRWRGAATLRDRIDESGTRPVLSRGLFETRYYTPPIFGRELRPLLWFHADLLNRQRADLGLEGFLNLFLDTSVAFEVRFLDQLSASLGVGLEHRRLFALDRSGSVDPIVDATPRHETLPFANAEIDLVLNPNEIRRDRKHLLSLETRIYARAEKDREYSLRVHGLYQKMFPLGFHELWFRLALVSLHGDVPFTAEEAVGGEHLRGPFTNTFYAKRIGSGGVEFRWSLVRDRFKVGLFHDLATFRAIHEVPVRKKLHFADAFGLGLHVLMLDAFQLDAYYGVGFASGGEFGRGFVLGINQAF